MLADTHLHREARPSVDALGRLTAQAIHLAVFDGRTVIVVGRSDPEPGSGRVIFESAPAHCTGVSKAIQATARCWMPCCRRSMRPGRHWPGAAA